MNPIINYLRVILINYHLSVLLSVMTHLYNFRSCIALHCIVILEMSSRSRRKTLCHTEIELFLEEIGSENVVDINSRKRRSTLINTNENHNKNIILNDEDVDSTKKHVLSIADQINIGLMMTNSLFLETPDISNSKPLSDEEMIREYCKVVIDI